MFPSYFFSLLLAVTLITKLLWVCTMNFKEHILSVTKPWCHFSYLTLFCTNVGC